MTSLNGNELQSLLVTHDTASGPRVWVVLCGRAGEGHLPDDAALTEVPCPCGECKRRRLYRAEPLPEHRTPRAYAASHTARGAATRMTGGDRQAVAREVPESLIAEVTRLLRDGNTEHEALVAAATQATNLQCSLPTGSPDPSASKQPAATG